MATKRFGFRTLACLSLWCGAASVHGAPAPTAAQMLEFKPQQPGVAITTPSGAELAACKIEQIKGVKLANGKTSGGWAMKDSQGRLLRRFVDSDGDGHVDVYSYYIDGQESYREADSNFNGKVDQYRWLGQNGSKWGVDTDENGKIDSWRVMSAEELSQEILHATATKDFARLQALMVTKAEMDALELPESEAARMRASMAAAPAKFQKTVTTLGLGEKTNWIHLETQVPQTIAADTLGAKYDLMRHKQGTILYENGGKHDFLQTGELVLIGRAWRIIDAPTPGTRNEQPATGSANLNVPDAIKELIEQLKVVDQSAPKTGKPDEVVQYNLARAAVLEKIAAALKGDDRIDWIKQIADCLSSAAQNSGKDKSAYERLAQWKAQTSKEAPNSALAAYVAFREMSAEYGIKLSEANTNEMSKLQEGWRDRLAKFVADFPTAEDTPDALMQLGMVSEFIGKETEAKNYYKQLGDSFKQHPLAAKATGAIRRLTLDGQELELTGTTLAGNAQFDVKSLKGKTVVVYYWASWNSQCAADFTKLKAILANLAPKGVELVTVNLDNTQAEAVAFLKQNGSTGTHLFQQGGLESPLAVNYGVFVLPNTFLIGPDGKVINRSAQIATLEDDLKKMLK